MFIVGMLSWWYGAGWKQRFLVAHENLLSVYDYFSIDLLLRTLFSPFRQISAGKVRGSLSVQMYAWFDKLFSRVVGFVVRSTVITIGSITLTITIIINGVAIVLWAFIPLIPLLGVVMAMIGWIPWTL